jgi:IPT/TIG domain-containing protein
MANGSKLKILTISLALAGALVGCDGGSYDPTTGRYTPASAPTNTAAAAQASASAPSYDSASAAYAPSAPSAAPSYTAPQGYSAGSGSTYAAPSGSAGASFDTFSRTPPPVVLQADGTPMKPAIARVSPESGAPEGGQEILITGSGFANVQVLFGSEPARITSQSSNAVTVIAPEGAAGRPVSIVVTNRDGSYAVAGHAFSYRG